MDTRGSESTTEAIKTDGFGVFGNYTSGADVSYGSGLFKNQKVTYSDTEKKWTYSPVKYWPTEGHIDFLAYAPHVENKTLTGSSIEFTVAKDVTKQEDLLWAKAVKQTKAANSGANKVKFTFNHALAKIGYSLKQKEAYDKTTITVTSIKLVGSEDEQTAAFYTKGTIDLSKANDLWTITDDTKQNFDWFSGSQELSTEYKPNNYLFVIPQDFSSTATDQLYVIVQYTVKTTDNTEITNTVSKKITKNFLQGKAYMINLIIGLTPIEFDATVDSWTNGESIGDIELQN